VFSISDDARIASRAPLPQRGGAIDRDLEQGAVPAGRCSIALDALECELAAVMPPFEPRANVNQERLHFCGRTLRIEVSRPRGVSTGFIAQPENI
jgi:hypothetical protein